MGGALQISGNPQILSSLIQALKHEEEEVRASAATLLGMHFMGETSSTLRALLDDPSTVVRTAVIHVLADYGDQSIIDRLLDMVQSQSEDDFHAVLEALSHYEDPRIVPALLEALENTEDSYTKWLTILTLSQFQDAHIVSTLAQLLHEEDMQPYQSGILHILTEYDTDEVRAVIEAWWSGEGLS